MLQNEDPYTRIDRLDKLYAQVVDWMGTLPTTDPDRDLELEFIRAAATIVTQPYFDVRDLRDVLVWHWWDHSGEPEVVEELKGYCEIAANMRREAEQRGLVR